MTRVSTAGTAAPGYLQTLLRRLPAGLILNLGAGTGRCGSPSQRVVHVDHAITMSGRAFVVGDAARLPFSADTFDGVLLKDVLEHLSDCIGPLTEVRRVTKSSGRLVVQVPRAIPRAVWDDPTHVRGFTAHALVEALQLAGWQAVGVPRRIGGFPGAGRFNLEPWLPTLMRVPLLGHRLGTNWLLVAHAA